jgi:hypothetical protein
MCALENRMDTSTYFANDTARLLEELVDERTHCLAHIHFQLCVVRVDKSIDIATNVGEYARHIFHIVRVTNFGRRLHTQKPPLARSKPAPQCSSKA